MSQRKPRPLDPTQRKAAEYIAKGHSISQTASVLKVRRETVSRWKNLPLFVAETEKCRRELHERALTCLPQMGDWAILAIAEQLYSGFPGERGQAALALLKLLGPEQIFNLQALQAPASGLPWSPVSAEAGVVLS